MVLKPAVTTVATLSATELEMASTMALDFAGELKVTRAGTDYITSSAGLVQIPIGALSIGSDPADTGTIRLENAATIYFEASPAGTDVRALTVDSSERVIVGEDTNAVDVQVRALTSVEWYAGGNLIAEAKAGEVEIQSTYALDFGGELKVSRAGSDCITSTASTLVLGPPGTSTLTLREQIFYGEYDGRRRKRVLVKIIGE